MKNDEQWETELREAAERMSEAKLNMTRAEAAYLRAAVESKEARKAYLQLERSWRSSIRGVKETKVPP